MDRSQPHMAKDSASLPTPSADARIHTSAFADFLRRFVRNKPAVVALGYLLALTLVAALAPLLAPYPFDASTLRRALEAPSAEHLLGTDDLGRDVLSRLLYASRVSLLASLQATVLAVSVGLPLGLISGYFGGAIDSVIMRFNDALMTFPALILAVVIVGLLGPSLRNAMVAVGVVYIPRILRVVRSSALAAREETYVLSSQAIGCTTPQIIVRHVLPNLLSPLVIQITILMGVAVLAEASLSFLGLGVQPPGASWGLMLGRSFPYMGRAPHTVISAGLAISITVVAFNVLGDGFRDSLGRERRTAD